ncbi:hypothetical protein [Azonexus fungiphilus]|uniref:hypothetical protein n=1 Tax=Azonexus fungiphilus TaxID=146940 RepID=UPI000EB158A1|nr:hypothetical protein [Azonexus fungiphilus]
MKKISKLVVLAGAAFTSFGALAAFSSSMSLSQVDNEVRAAFSRGESLNSVAGGARSAGVAPSWIVSSMIGQGKDSCSVVTAAVSAGYDANQVISAASVSGASSSSLVSCAIAGGADPTTITAATAAGGGGGGSGVPGGGFGFSAPATFQIPGGGGSISRS